MKEKTKVVIIIFLVLIILALLAYIFYSTRERKPNDNLKSDFLQDLADIQARVSYYIGNTYSDTFGIYDKEQIMTAKLNANNTKENDKNNKRMLTPLVDENSKIERSQRVYYKILDTNFEKLTNSKLPKYEGISWYIQDGDYIKVHLDKKPDWWTPDLEGFEI